MLPELVMLVEEFDLPELTDEQIQEVCLLAEETVHNHIFSRISAKKVETLNASAEVDGAKPMKLTVDVDIVLSPSMRDFNVKKLADEAVAEAFKSVEKWLSEIGCHSLK